MMLIGNKTPAPQKNLKNDAATLRLQAIHTMQGMNLYIVVPFRCGSATHNSQGTVLDVSHSPNFLPQPMIYRIPTRTVIDMTSIDRSK